MKKEIFLVLYYHDLKGEDEIEAYPHMTLEGAQAHLTEIKKHVFSKLSINDNDKHLDENSENHFVYRGDFMKAEITVEKKEIAQ